MVYLPLVRGGQGGVTPTPTQPAPAQRGARFLGAPLKHHGADIAIDAAGGMHAAYTYYTPSAENPRAVYTFCYGCDAECAEASSWRRLFVVLTGGGATPHPSWDLAFDGAGHPRVALFLGDSITPEDYINQLLYIACDAADCLAPGDTWSFSQVLKVKGAGQGADVEVDGQGRPRLAWIDQSGDLGYAWCEAARASDAAVWRQQIVETEAQLRAANPQAIPSHCRNDLWNGVAPVLALDSGGSPRIAYDVAVSADCYYDTTPGYPSDPPTVRFEPIWRGARLSFFPQP